MRSSIIAITLLSLLIPSMILPQKQVPTRSQCSPQQQGLAYFFEEKALESIEPPNWKHALIRIGVSSGTKLYLSTDGEKFTLWTSSTTFRDADRFLLNLERSCRLPIEPQDAAALIPVKWESVDLKVEDFAQIHRDLTNALARYAASAQENYASILETNGRAIYLDATAFRVVYDNSYQSFQAEVVDDPKQNKAMLEWIQKLQKVAEERFHHTIWNHENTGR